MTEKLQIKFWQKASKIIKKEFSPPCKDFNLFCSTCQAHLVLSWIDEHIETLKWANKPMPKRWLVK